MRKEGELAEVGRYSRLTDANERTPVILAMGLGCWILPEGDVFVLCVESRHLADVARELEKFEIENPRRAEHPKEPGPGAKTPSASLFIFAWMMGLFFLMQQTAPEAWTEKGAASSVAILRHGEWWRTVTALTLHADFSHLAANLAASLLFAAFLLPILGTGLTWMSILLSGGLGNYLNAWGYRNEEHVSIGASTAVFGALGILVACQTLFLLGEGRRVRLWEIILPAGAGLALLAWLGRGDAQTDYMAHFWGFGAGCATGTAAGWLRLKERLSPFLQKMLAGLSLVIPAVAWALTT
jgi:membrane associated rhomboid family serine protease